MTIVIIFIIIIGMGPTGLPVWHERGSSGLAQVGARGSGPGHSVVMFTGHIFGLNSSVQSATDCNLAPNRAITSSLGGLVGKAERGGGRRGRGEGPGGWGGGGRKGGEGGGGGGREAGTKGGGGGAQHSTLYSTAVVVTNSTWSGVLNEPHYLFELLNCGMRGRQLR